LKAFDFEVKTNFGHKPARNAGKMPTLQLVYNDEREAWEREKIIRREPLILAFVRKQVHIPDDLVIRQIIRVRKAGNVQSALYRLSGRVVGQGAKHLLRRVPWFDSRYSSKILFQRLV